MKPPSPWKLQPPDGDSVEGLLSVYDSDPRLIPEWPASRRMTLVAVVVVDFDTAAEQDAAGYVLTEQSQANALVSFDVSHSDFVILFFKISKQRAKEFCPGLTDEAWVVGA